MDIDFCNKSLNFLDKIYPALKCYASMPVNYFDSGDVKNWLLGVCGICQLWLRLLCDRIELMAI